MVLLGGFFQTQEGTAQTIHGRLTTTFYAFQRHELNGETLNNLRAYQLLSFTVANLGSPRLSFRAYALWNSDLRAAIRDDPRIWVYQAYFRYKSRFGELRLGRQRIFAGVGIGTIDGVRLKLRVSRLADVEAYLGTQLPLSASRGFDSWKDSHMFGLSLSSRVGSQTYIGVSFVQKNRTPRPYREPGLFTGEQWLLYQGSSLQQRRVGLDLRHAFGPRASASGRFDFDLIHRRFHRVELNGRLGSRRVHIGLDYIFRNPIVDANSIFSVFAQRSNAEIAGRVIYYFKRTLGVLVRFAHVMFEGKDTQRFTVALQLKRGYVGFNYQSGYGGNRGGIVGDLRYPVTRKIWLRVGSNYVRYRLYGLGDEYSTALAGILGLNIRLARTLWLDVEGQGLQNRGLRSDFRLRVQVSYRFARR